MEKLLVLMIPAFCKVHASPILPEQLLHGYSLAIKSLDHEMLDFKDPFTFGLIKSLKFHFRIRKQKRREKKRSEISEDNSTNNRSIEKFSKIRPI